jgi:hypothetical protein
MESPPCHPNAFYQFSMTTNNYHCLVCQQVKPPPDPKTTSKCPFCNHINPKIQFTTCGKCKHKYRSCCLEKENWLNSKRCLMCTYKGKFCCFHNSCLYLDLKDDEGNTDYVRCRVCSKKQREAILYGW